MQGVPGWYRLWPHASFHSQHRGNVYFGQVTPLCFKTFKHFVFLSIFSSVVGSRTFVHPRNPHPFSLFPKKKPVHTPIRIIHCVQRVNGNFKCFPPTETYIYIHACHWILLDRQMHRRLPPPGCACVNGGNREQVESKRHRVIRAPLR